MRSIAPLTGVLVVCAIIQLFLLIRHPKEPSPGNFTFKNNETAMARLRQEVFCEDAPSAKEEQNEPTGDAFCEAHPHNKNTHACRSEALCAAPCAWPAFHVHVRGW